MLGLWSRAAQARALCNCPSCLSATARVLQRTSQAPLQRRPIRPSAFTFFSSTLAVSAAVAHGLTKDQKLQEWNKVIEQTKADIEAVDKEHEARIQKLRDNAFSRNHALDESLASDSAWLAQTSWVEVLEFAEQERAKRSTDGYQNWEGMPSSMLKNLHDFDLKRILSYKWLLHRYYGGADCANLVSHIPTHAYSVKKLRTMEWSMLKLARKLVAHESSCENSVLSDIEDAKRRLSQLRSEPEASPLYEKFPSPNAPNYQFSPSQRSSELMKFNANLEAMLFQEKGSSQPDLQAVGDALLSSDTAPDIHTYNLLLVKFCRMRADKLVAATIESMEETHIRPNEISHATILRFYTLAKNRMAFRSYLRRMNGFGQGIDLANPHRSIDALAQARYRSVGKHEKKHAELARLNGEVYACLIKGLIEMFDYREAAWYYMRMISEGWKPTMELLTTMLKHCCDIADIASGWRIWKAIMDTSSADQKITQAAYELMLELCYICDKFGLYHWVSQQGTQCGALASNYHTLVNNDSMGGTVATAISHTITVEELRNRFPYLPSEELRTPWKAPWQELDPAHTLRLEGEFSSNEIYDVMRNALLKPSFADAQTFLRDHKSMPRKIRKTMENEASWVFGRLEALSSLNTKYARRTELTSKHSPPEQKVQVDKPREAFDLAGLDIMPQDKLLAAIQVIDASLSPKPVLRRYHDFQKYSFDEQHTLKAGAP